MAKQKTYSQISGQIKALEIKMTKMVAEGMPYNKVYAVHGKLKNLRKKLEDIKHEEYLSK